LNVSGSPITGTVEDVNPRTLIVVVPIGIGVKVAVFDVGGAVPVWFEVRSKVVLVMPVVLYFVSVLLAPPAVDRYRLMNVAPGGKAGNVTLGMLPEDTVKTVESGLRRVSPAAVLNV
jgi:hypothetical protein